MLLYLWRGFVTKLMKPLNLFGTNFMIILCFVGYFCILWGSLEFRNFYRALFFEDVIFFWKATPLMRKSKTVSSKLFFSLPSNPDLTRFRCKVNLSVAVFEANSSKELFFSWKPKACVSSSFIRTRCHRIQVNARSCKAVEEHGAPEEVLIARDLISRVLNLLLVLFC